MAGVESVSDGDSPFVFVSDGDSPFVFLCDISDKSYAWHDLRFFAIMGE